MPVRDARRMRSGTCILVDDFGVFGRFGNVGVGLQESVVLGWAGTSIYNAPPQWGGASTFNMDGN